jgi:hypothetical protein
MMRTILVVVVVQLSALLLQAMTLQAQEIVACPPLQAASPFSNRSFTAWRSGRPRLSSLRREVLVLARTLPGLL